jgi:hypothetical protein
VFDPTRAEEGEREFIFSPVCSRSYSILKPSSLRSARFTGTCLEREFPTHFWYRSHETCRSLDDAGRMKMSDDGDGFVVGERYLLMHRDGKFSTAFRATLKPSGLQSWQLPRSDKEECLEQMIFIK